MIEKGIILAGGNGTRNWPLTDQNSKQMLGVAGLPMILYPLNTLLRVGVTDVLIIVSLQHAHQLMHFLNPIVNKLEISVRYAVQTEPRGLPEAFTIDTSFIDGAVLLILGDNIFEDTETIAYAAQHFSGGGHIFAKKVSHPEQFGVVRFDDSGNAVEIVEKPTTWISDFAIPGIYIYDNHVVDIAKGLPLSDRGEYEIVDVHRAYLVQKQLRVTELAPESAWLDAGTLSALDEANDVVKKRHIAKNFHTALLDAIAACAPCAPEEFMRRLFYY